MIFLKRENGTIITSGIRNLSPLMMDSTIIENKLIDGSTHLQTIGEPAGYYTFDILASHLQTGLINTARATVEPLILVVGDEEIRGFIKNAEWERANNRFHDTDKLFYIANGVRFELEGSI